MIIIPVTGTNPRQNMISASPFQYLTLSMSEKKYLFILNLHILIFPAVQRSEHDSESISKATSYGRNRNLPGKESPSFGEIQSG